MRLGYCRNIVVVAKLPDKITGFGIAVEVKSITVMIDLKKAKNGSQPYNKRNTENSSRNSL